MPTTVRRVTVGRETPSAADVLDYAAEMIRTFGWNKIKGGTVTPSSDEVGYTLHDAIGEACTRLSKTVAPAGSSGSKDWTVTNSEGVEKNLRNEATRAVEAAIKETTFKVAPAGATIDQQYNDKAKNVDQVLAILDKARAAVAE